MSLTISILQFVFWNVAITFLITFLEILVIGSSITKDKIVVLFLFNLIWVVVVEFLVILPITWQIGLTVNFSL